MAQQVILEPELSSLFSEKFPLHLPGAIKAQLVRSGPYAVLALLTLTSLFIALSGELALFLSYTLHLKQATALAVLLCSLLTGFMSIPGLLQRRRQGWTYLYRAGLLYVLSCIISLDVTGLLLMSTLGFYILFEVRQSYR